MANHITNIQEKPGKLREDYNMSTQAGSKDGRAVPKNIIRLAVDRIRVGKRMRPVDHEAVNRLHADILHHGLLQPIGVQKNANDTDYTVVYGVHRFLAFKRGWAEAQKLIEERGETNADARAAAIRWQEIPVIVYSDEMPADYALLKEITENLIRQMLTPEETDVHRVKYAHLLKKLKLVVTADEMRSETQKPKSKGRVPLDGGDVNKVTATERTTKDLGISNKTLETTHQRVNKLAQAVARDKGLAAPVKITAESPITQETEHTLRLAEFGAAKKAEARKEGGDPRKVFTSEPTKPTVITRRIDLSDPADLVAWFGDQMKDATKPMSLSFVKRVYKGLGELIATADRD